MSAGRVLRRVLSAIVHNWPLKLAAVVLASLLYVGLVATQDSNTSPGPIPVTWVNKPAGTVVTNQLKSVDEVRYIAPADLGRLTIDDFRATVDLGNVQPSGTATSVRVSVVAVDPRVTVLEVRPRTIPVVLDEETSVSVPVKIVRGAAPPGVEVGDTTYVPQQVAVAGPSVAVKKVVAVRVDVTLDPSGLDYDQEVQGTPVDADGSQVTGVELNPRTVHVTIPLYKNKQSRSVPVNPVLTGTPAPGFRVAGVSVTPLTVTLEGDADQLVKITSADTASVPIYGATRSLTQSVTFALPSGVTPIAVESVEVTVQIEPVTETRTFTAGLRLDGGDPTVEYGLSVQTVLLTVYGSSADLDRLASTPITVGLDVSGLDAGSHALPVVPSLPSGVTVVTIDPPSVTVIVTPPPSPSPSASAAPDASPAPSPS